MVWYKFIWHKDSSQTNQIVHMCITVYCEMSIYFFREERYNYPADLLLFLHTQLRFFWMFIINKYHQIYLVLDVVFILKYRVITWSECWILFFFCFSHKSSLSKCLFYFLFIKESLYFTVFFSDHSTYNILTCLLYRDFSLFSFLFHCFYIIIHSFDVYCFQDLC